MSWLAEPSYLPLAMYQFLIDSTTNALGILISVTVFIHIQMIIHNKYLGSRETQKSTIFSKILNFVEQNIRWKRNV